MKKNQIKLFIFSFLMCWLCAEMSLAQEAKVIDRVIGIVGRHAIFKSHIEGEYLRRKAQGLSSRGDMKCEIFEEFLIQKLLVNQAEVDSIEVTDKEIDMTLEQRISYMSMQIGSEEDLEAYFNKSMPEIKRELRKSVKEQLLTQRMQSEITKDVKVTPSDVQKFYKNLPTDSLPYINSQVEYQQIVIQPEIKPQAIEEVKERLNDMRERIQEGESFRKFAVMYSEDPGSATKGGELGFMHRNDLVPEFSAVAFKLEQGDVSRIVETDFGYHIIQLIERRGESVNVRHILLTPKIPSSAAYSAKKTLDSIARLIRNDSISFEMAAMKFSDDEDSRANGGLVVNPYAGTSKFDIKELDRVTHYALKSLKASEISEPFESQNNKGQKVYKIVRLKSRTEPHVANLKADYKIIQDMALNAKKQETLNEWIEKKQRESYISIDKSYSNCPFSYKGWIKDVE